MKLKLKDIVIAEESLGKLLEVKLPIKASYRLKRLVDKIAPELETFRTKRLELFKEYGEHDEEKNQYTINHLSEEKRKEFNDKFEELLDIEVEVDYEKLKIDDLGDASVEPKLIIDWVFE